MFAQKITDRHELRLFESDHAVELFALVDTNRCYLRAWLPWVDSSKSVNDTSEFIAGSLHNFADLEGLAAGIWVADKLAGSIGVHDIDFHNRSAQLGYWLAEPLQGRGIVTDSCRAMIRYLFVERDLNKIVIRCASDNARSRAIPESLGFQHEGRCRDAARLHDQLIDLEIYSLLRREWASRAGN
jgi:ribosomal-protein-serine acetyltransferase